MSTRINLSTFSYEKLNAMFGSGDEQLIGSVIETILDLEDYGMLTARDAKLATKTLERAVTDGVPLSNLRNEGRGHVELANLLATYKQRHGALDFDGKYFAVADFWSRFRDDFDKSGRNLFDFLIVGRPLFGSSIPKRLEIRYGYLLQEELPPLVDALRSLRDRYDGNEEVEEVANGYTQCLDRVRRNARDVWIYVC